MKTETEKLLTVFSDYDAAKGYKNVAYNIREDGLCAGRQSTEHIKIESKTDAPGLVITVSPEARDETVYIPACVTHTGVDDLVYNDFHIGEGAVVTIVAGCGVHAEEGGEARHNGIHRFFIGRGARVIYREKHIGTGKSSAKSIDPVTDATLEEGASLTMDTIQLGGVDKTDRKTRAVLGPKSKLVIRERIMTDGDETAKTDFEVALRGEGSGVDLVSRSVAKGSSVQSYASRIVGEAPCTGHSECDAILVGNGKVHAAPMLSAENPDAALIHELRR